MADPIDPARVGIQLDRAEEAGLIETDVAGRLRRLVGDSEAISGRFSVDIHPWTGCTAWHAAEHAAAVSARLGRPVMLVFNGDRIPCYAGDGPLTVHERYVAAIRRPRPFEVDLPDP